MAGSGLYALPSIARAAKNIIYVGNVDAEDVLATAARERVTIMAFLGADHDPHAARGRLREQYSVLSLRRVVYGGGPIDPGLAAAAIERFGPVFVQLYGMGESPMTITYLRPQDHRGQGAVVGRDRAHGRGGSVGR